MSKFKPGDHIIYYKKLNKNRTEITWSAKCIFVDETLHELGYSSYTLKFKVNHNLGIFTETTFTIYNKDEIELDKQYYRDLKLNNLGLHKFKEKK
jgi:hypothetical protein